MTKKNRLGKSKLYVKKQIRDLNTGDIVLHPIFRSDGLMLIKHYKTLTEDLAAKIKQLVPGILPVLVLSPKCDMEAFEKEEGYNNSAMLAELEKLCVSYSEYMHAPLEITSLLDIRSSLTDSLGLSDTIDITKSAYISFLSKSPFFSSFEKKLESSHLQSRARRAKQLLVKTIMEQPVLEDKLNRLMDYKDILLLHSVNTTCISIIIGLVLELSDEALMDLAITNLLVDISVAKMPKAEFNEFLTNPQDNYSFYRLHLAQLRDLSQELSLVRKESIFFGVLDQYELYNGKGFPKGKKGSEIGLFGRIIAISQAYDEMVGGYYYNSGIKPIQAIQEIWAERGEKFDPDIVRILIDRSSLMKVGQQIILKNFQQGTIIGYSDFISHPLSPIVMLEDETIVDLLKTDLI
jgi:HD-GYP domain-containing protein (c-di-GMP phosphodiesterase class II)